MKHSIKKLLKRHFLEYLAILIGAFCVLGGIGALWVANLEIPSLESFDNRKVTQSTKIYDRTGEVLLYDLHQDARRTIVPANLISQNMKNAVIAIEDARFYIHAGVDWQGVSRAVFSVLSTFSFSQGGSTITQQVIKNTLLTADKSPTRKIKELILALKLEKHFTKEEILSFYLNESPFGGALYGVEEAAQAYFNKNAANLTVAESAYLAAMLKAPTYYSPFGQNRDKLEARKNLVLKRMFDEHLLTKEEYAAAKIENVTFNSLQKSAIKAPHFVNYVINELEAKYGTDVVQNGGLRVQTTLDYTLETKAEETVLKFAKVNETKFKAKNAGMVAIDPKSGDILVMVGSRDYFDPEIDGNYNIATALRQPGSLFKPFVYSAAFKKGYLPETVLFDVPTEFSPSCSASTTLEVASTTDSKCYRPKNFDDKWRGPISLRSALAESRNIPAIKALYLAGANDSLRTARDMGITSITDANQYGLTLVLGGGEVSLLEITSAYGVFATNGTRHPFRSILHIDDASGKTLFSAEDSSEQVLDANIAKQITSILSDDEARAPTFGRNSLLVFPNRDVAAKTGTTNDYRDVWIAGYTPDIVVGAWAGNNDNSSMEHKISGLIITPMWRAFMDEALQTVRNSPFEPPEDTDIVNIKPALRGIWQGNTTYFVDKTTGRPAATSTPIENRIEKVVSDIHSILHWVDKKDPNGPIPEHPEEDSQYVNWEYGVQMWVKDHPLSQ